MRRNLQREYVLRASRTSLLRPAGTLPADARALLRADATQAARARSRSRKDRKRAVAGGEGAPRRERSRMLDEALKAPLIRAGGMIAR